MFNAVPAQQQNLEGVQISPEQLPFVRRFGGGAQPSAPRQLIAGALHGLQQDVLLGPAVNFIADVLPGTSSEEMDQFIREASGRPMFQGASFIAEMGAMLAAFTPASLLGRAAAGSALKVLAKNAAARNPAIKGLTQLGKVAQKADDIGGNPEIVLPRLAIERATEVLGSSAGFAGIEGLYAGLEGEGGEEIAQRAATAFALGAVFETALIGAGMATRKARAAFTDQNKVLDAAKNASTTVVDASGKNIIPREETIGGVFAATRQDLKGQLKKTYQKIDKILNVPHTVVRLVSKPGKTGEILTALQNNPNQTAEQLANAVSISIREAKRLLSSAQKSGLVASTTRRGRLTKKDFAQLPLKELLGAKDERAIQKFRLGKKAFEKRKEVFKRELFLKNEKGERVSALYRGAPKQREVEGRALKRIKNRDAEKIKRLLEERRALRSTMKAADDIEHTNLLRNITSQRVFSPSEARRNLIIALRKLAVTPEGAQGAGGVVQNQVLQALKQADDAIIREMGITFEKVKQAQDTTFKLLRTAGPKRISQRDFNKQVQDGLLLRMIGKFEDSTAGTTDKLQQWLIQERGLTPKAAKQVGDTMMGLSEMAGGVFNRVLKVGGRSPLDFKKAGVNNYWPHIFDAVTQDDLYRALAEKGIKGKSLRPDQIYDIMLHSTDDPDDIVAFVQVVKELGLDPNKVRTASDLFDSVDRKTYEAAIRRFLSAGPEVSVKTRMTKFNSFDASRSLSGNIESKFVNGLPMARNPFDGVLRYLHAGSRRANVAEVLGSKGQLIDTYAQAVAVEVGHEQSVLFKRLLEEYIHNDFYSSTLRDMSKFFTSSNVASKMTFGVIANMTQPVLNVVSRGVWNTMLGLKGLFDKETRHRLHQMMALNHSMIADTGRMMGEEGLGLSIIERLAEASLKWTQFTRFESANRIMSGSVGYAVTKDIISRGALGRLRGRALEDARRTAGELDFGLDDIIGRLRALNPDGTINGQATAANVADFFNTKAGRAVMDNAAFLQAQRTQFIPSKFRRPEVWNHPLGRVAFQFKTFSMQMTRFLRDSVLAEAAIGNVKPLAYFMGAAPVVGEYVADARAYVRGTSRPDNPYERVFENTLSLGGFAMAGDLFYALRSADVFGFAMGPTASTGEDLMIAMFKAMTEQDVSPFGKLLGSLPSYQASYALYGAVDHTADMITNYSEAPLYQDPQLPFRNRPAVPIDLLEDSLRRKGRR